jgi:predicted site-specific integrase-resolvase
MDNQIILTQTTKDDLINQITNNVLNGMASIMKASRETDIHAKEWLSSKETDTLLKISAVTRWNWTNAGILKSYKIGNRLRYRKDEVLQALLQIESKKR